jgi:hypothetical protein
VTIDGVWIALDLLTTYKQHSELEVVTALSLISTIYKSPALSLLSILTSRILPTDFNAVIIAVSL